MNPKLSFWTGLGCTVLVTIGRSIALAGGRPGGQFSGGMKAKAPQTVHRPVPAQQTSSLGRHSGLQPDKTQVISGTLSGSSSARRLPGGTLGGSIPGKIPSGGLTPLSGTIVKQSTGAGIGARIVRIDRGRIPVFRRVLPGCVQLLPGARADRFADRS